MKIINEHFEVGQCYAGMVSGEVFTISNIREAGKYETKSGGVYTVTQTLVEFSSEKTGKTRQTELETAKRLLLKAI